MPHSGAKIYSIPAALRLDVSILMDCKLVWCFKNLQKHSHKIWAQKVACDPVILQAPEAQSSPLSWLKDNCVLQQLWGFRVWFQFHTGMKTNTFWMFCINRILFKCCNLAKDVSVESPSVRGPVWVEGAGLIQHGKEQAPGRPHCSFLELEGSLQAGGRLFFFP